MSGVLSTVTLAKPCENIGCLPVIKQDLLDEVSETEDRIVRNKALERGDRLMSLFLKTVGGRPAVGIGVDKGKIGGLVVRRARKEQTMHG